MMPLASCLKGVLRECVLTPTTLPHQHHLALSQSIRMAINHALRKRCHPRCSSSPIPLSSCLALSPPRLTKCILDSGNVFFSPLAADLPHSDENVSPASSCFNKELF